MSSRRDAEARVELLKGQVLGFGNKKQDQDPANHAPRRIIAEGTRVAKCVLETWKGDGQQEVEEPRQRRRHGHTCSSIQQTPIMWTHGFYLPTSRTYSGMLSAE